MSLRERAVCRRPAEIGAEALLELALDEEEEVLDLAGIDQRRRIDFGIDAVEGRGDLAGLVGIENAGFGQHHQMGAVDGAEAVDMMVLGAVEQRRQHGLLVDRIGKDREIGKAWIGHRLTLQTGEHDAAHDVALQHQEDEQASGMVPMAAPVMISSHWIDASTAKLESPTGSV